jgi:MFS transporter, PPP family, 3-phenylpropionic acid transporter
MFMAGGAYFAYIGIYFTGIKLNTAQIGIITSVGLLVGMLAQPVWGTISDRSKNKNILLNIMLFIAAVTVWFVPAAGDSFWLLIIAISVMNFFGSGIQPMGDAITQELAKREGFKFSTVRLVGSLGFAVMAGIAGKILVIDIRLIFVMFSVLRVFGGIVSIFIPKVAGHPKSKEEKDSFFDLFKDRKLNVLYMYVFLLSITAGFFGSFHSIYSKQVGISLEVIGLGVMIGSISQFPFMFFFDWFYKKLGINKIMIISGITYIIRWFFYYQCLNSVTIILLWALHGLCFIVLYLCLSDYVSINVPKRLKTRGQVMNYIVLLGASAIVGSMLGGFLSNIFSLKLTFLFCSGLSLVSLLGFIIASRVLPEFKKDKFAPLKDTPIPDTEG